MSVLSYQSIVRRCQGEHPLITPFEPNRIVKAGKSYGASAASYDARIASDLVVGVNPAIIIADHAMQYGFDPESVTHLRANLRNNPPMTALANTIEDFWFPDDLSGAVADKSTYARMFVSLYNTFFDPGFHGNATLEIVNHSAKPIILKAGDPICQFIFTKLDEETDRPYGGKYQGQIKEPMPAIMERTKEPFLKRRR